MTSREVVLVTGISGNLGLRLLPLLTHRYDVVGLDLRAPQTDRPLRFEAMDLGDESSTDRIIELLRETGAKTIVHLAFVIDPQRTGVLDVRRMWQINVAGTARVMEAIAVVNRHGGDVRKFIFPSSVSAYGPETPPFVNESYRLGAHTLPYAIHKQQCDELVQFRADTIGDCSIYMVRPHIFAGASVQNYLIGALRGAPLGSAPRAARMRREGKRLPLMLPWGKTYLQKKFQFVHIDDMARLMAFFVRRELPAKHNRELVTLNVAGKGDALTIEECAHIAGQKLVRLPRWLCMKVLEVLWNRGISTIPPAALPYMVGSYTMDTTALRRFLGPEYDEIIRFSNLEALTDSFRTLVSEEPAPVQPSEALNP